MAHDTHDTPITLPITAIPTTSYKKNTKAEEERSKSVKPNKNMDGSFNESDPDVTLFGENHISTEDAVDAIKKALMPRDMDASPLKNHELGILELLTMD